MEELAYFDCDGESLEIVDEKARRNMGDLQEGQDSHIENKSNPHEVTKEQVGLGNVDNTSDLKKPVSTATQFAIDLAYASSNAYTDQKIADLINGAPTTMDTLKEIADAMEENQDVVEALEEAIGKKANQAEMDTHTGNDTIHVTESERTSWDGKADASAFGTQMTSGTILSNRIQSNNVKVKTMFVVTGTYKPEDYPFSDNTEAFVVYLADNGAARQKVLVIQYQGTRVYERSIFFGAYNTKWAYEKTSIASLNANGVGTRVKVTDKDLKIYSVEEHEIATNIDGTTTTTKQIIEFEIWSASNHTHEPQSRLKSENGNELVIQNDNNLVVYDSDDNAIWSSKAPVSWSGVTNIECGNVGISPTAVNQVTTVWVPFTRTFTEAPHVVATAQSSTPDKCHVSVTNIEKTGFNMNLIRTDSTVGTQIHWIAMV